MTNYIWITTQKELIHKYEQAPDDVAFLRNEHRHIFHFKIYIEIKHDNRDIEFILFKRFCENIINEMNINLDNKSCEMISKYIYNKIGVIYPYRKIKIEISEDNENGVEYNFPIYIT